MLNLDYALDVPHAMIATLEHHARALGASLDDLERLGQSLDTVEAFILACEAGRGTDYLAAAASFTTRPVAATGIAA